jgi:hypothetical protein
MKLTELEIRKIHAEYFAAVNAALAGENPRIIRLRRSIARLTVESEALADTLSARERQ